MYNNYEYCEENTGKYTKTYKRNTNERFEELSNTIDEYVIYVWKHNNSMSLTQIHYLVTKVVYELSSTTNDSTIDNISFSKVMKVVDKLTDELGLHKEEHKTKCLTFLNRLTIGCFHEYRCNCTGYTMERDFTEFDKQVDDF